MVLALTAARPRRRVLLSTDDWSVADLGSDICALVFWRGPIVKVIVSDRVHDDNVSLVAVHALTHRDDEHAACWGETTARCDAAHCWAAQTWLPSCFVDVRELAPPA